MDNKNNEKKSSTTKYGENIPSMFSWLSLEKQKSRAEELSKITQKKK